MKNYVVALNEIFRRNNRACNNNRSCSVVVITSALHAEGRGFEPRRDLRFFFQTINAEFFLKIEGLRTSVFLPYKDFASIKNFVLYTTSTYLYDMKGGGSKYTKLFFFVFSKIISLTWPKTLSYGIPVYSC